ncbi:MAG: class I tRNA ligase family protein [bacterium]
MQNNNKQQEKTSFPQMEEDVLKFWEENKIFEKSVEKDNPEGDYVFYDGPPFATGTPHYGHIAASIMKDAVPRYWTMRGYRVERRWGWDCHGLPIENIVEKEIGSKAKKDIVEKIGVAKFNEMCRSKVLGYVEEWKKVMAKLGRWADMENSYKTMDLDFMESVWYVFKELYDKGLIYEGYRSMHICPRCETTLSQSEISEGYKDVKDLSATVKFKLEAGQKIGNFITDENTYVLAWTTTPWTLIGNVALAVGGDIDYVKVKLSNQKTANKLAVSGTPADLHNGEPDKLNNSIADQENLSSFKINKSNVEARGVEPHRRSLSDSPSKPAAPALNKLYQKDEDNSTADEFYILAKDRISDVLKDKEFEIIEEFKGKDLIGKKYKPVFDYYSNNENLENKENGWKIYAGDFVTTEEGTGVVHIAPAFGEDDMNLGKKYNLPFVQHIGMDGIVKKEATDFAGMSVKTLGDHTKTDIEIIKYLAHHNLLFSKEKYEHSYPHCWRCDTPLLNYATSSWFVSITKIKEQMLANAKDINWSPEYIKDGRFGNWLEGARDWSISRQRFWASVIPIWKCEKCGELKVIGSIDELSKNSVQPITKLIFVRHGESENNILNVRSSDVNKFKLTEKGRKQIQDVTNSIEDEVDVIISSPLIRAKESAEIMKNKVSADIITDDLIAEFNHGEWENTKKEELSEKDDYKQYKKLSGEEKYNFKFGLTGESRADMVARVEKFIKKVVEEHKGKTVLVASHSGVSPAIKKVIRNYNTQEYFASEENLPKGRMEVFYLNEDGQEIDIHKHVVDEITFKCEKCDGEMKRIPDVLDTWFDSGSMPYAQAHYPFENKEKFEKNFPAEFIAEGIDQTRCWFYYMHAIAVGIKDTRAYNNVIVNGIVLAEDGKKMSKKLKNYPDPMLILDRYGADALRFYLLTSPVMAAENLNFSESGVVESLRKNIMLLWNVYKFYEIYAGDCGCVVDQNNEELKFAPTPQSPRGDCGGTLGCPAPQPLSGDCGGALEEPQLHCSAGVSHQGTPALGEPQSENILDKWILAKLNQLISDVTVGMDKYDLPKASRPITDFINDFSTWYLRRSRDRFKGEDKNDKNSALKTTGYVLLQLSKVMAPFMPFIAEQIWQKVTGNNFEDENKSVHLESWPDGRDALQCVSADVIKEMSLIREIVEQGLSARAEKGIKVRQPLSELKVKSQKSKVNIELINLIKDELNVKEVSLVEEIESGDNWAVKETEKFKIALNKEITHELELEGCAREIVRTINNLRKDAGLSINDTAEIYYTKDSEIEEILKVYGSDILKDTLCVKYSAVDMSEIEMKKEVKIGENEVEVGIKY